MKVLIYSSCNDFHSMEIAKELIEAGNQVFFLQCDSFQRICQRNKKGNWLMCKHCQIAMNNKLKKLNIVNNCIYMHLSDLIKNEDIKEAESFPVVFKTVEDLKNLTYKEAQVGYGAFSFYVTLSRNVMPDMIEIKDYITFLIRKEVVIYNIIDRLHTQYNFDKFVLHNGRFAQFKPFLEYAKKHNINFICTEQKIVNGHLLKDYFENDIPHSLDYLAKNVLRNWEIGNISERDAIGRSFFEKRKKGIKAGDKVYIKDQHAGEMPADWNDKVENITVFNSSEDEFCAISREYDRNLLFPNQYIALKTIFDHYKGDNTKHFYVRIHPNLKDVPFKSHLALYELKYDNVTIIPANSTISSYTLLDHSDKIIIFDSTMGVEAAYWGKPVIALTKYIYWKLGFLYHPDEIEDIWPLIDDKQLKVSINDNLIKYGYWLLHPNYPELSRVAYKYVHFNILGKDFTDCSALTILKSHRLRVLLDHFLNKMPYFNVFKKIPGTNPYLTTAGPTENK